MVYQIVRRLLSDDVLVLYFTGSSLTRRTVKIKIVLALVDTLSGIRELFKMVAKSMELVVLLGRYCEFVTEMYIRN